jgi:HAD superfamily hydrolase (TIGR01509 family)
MKRIRAVAWDVDGTLVDSEPLHHRALVAASSHWGVDLGDLPDQAFRGVHIADVWIALKPRMPDGLDKSEWIAAITAHYIENRGELEPLPGVVETIAALALREIPQVCVSNSHRTIVTVNLEALGILPQIDFIVALDDVVKGKPDPEPYSRATSWLRLAPGEVLAVEDSAAGVASAFGAGLRVALCGAEAGPVREDLVRIASPVDILRLPGLS